MPQPFCWWKNTPYRSEATLLERDEGTWIDRCGMETWSDTTLGSIYQKFAKQDPLLSDMPNTSLERISTWLMQKASKLTSKGECRTVLVRMDMAKGSP